MFGSLRIAKDRLDEAQSELYRGHFCGACHAMHRLGGRTSSLLTNYDQTLLGIVLGGMQGATAVRQRPCTAFPLRRVGVVDLGPTSQKYLAAVNLALVEAKLLDDAEDDKRWRTRVGLYMVRTPARRAFTQLTALGFDTSALESLTADQTAVELSTTRRLDRLAEPSARLIGDIFAFVAQLAGRPEHEPDLRRFGRSLGTFLYIWDAWIDQAEDRKTNRFNAIDRCFPEARGFPEDLAGQRPAALRDSRVEIAARLRYHAELLEALTMGLPLGPQRAVVQELLATLRTKTEHQVRPHSAEAGVCEACEVCTCCEIGEGPCACLECCSGCEVCFCFDRKKRRAKKAVED